MAGLGIWNSPTTGLAKDFWEWRSRQQPSSHDDIVRVERPPLWAPMWAVDDIRDYRETLAGFEARSAALRTEVYGGPGEVDLRLVECAIARVRWELDVAKGWEWDPSFYIDQTLGSYFELLLPNEPFDQNRLSSILTVLDSIPTTLASAQGNLAGHLYRESTISAATQLERAPVQLAESIAALPVSASTELRRHLELAATSAGHGVSDFRLWLLAQPMDAEYETVPVGRSAFCTFLYKVALLPYSPEELLSLGQWELDRAVVWEHLATELAGTSLESHEVSDRRTQISNEEADEAEIRAFYVARGLLSQPSSLGRYLHAPLPAYMRPLSWAGLADDLTSESRLDRDGLRYIPEPTPVMPYFARAFNADPRLAIAHEGVHYQQLAMSWAHPNPIRRHYYDSCANEGIAFYNEELLLRAGLFTDNERTTVLVNNFMRLRALRVEVDVRLALGDVTVTEAASLLETRVPLDPATARAEARFFAANPGQGLSYQVGKTQLLSLIATACEAKSGSRGLQSLHDYIWLNGNVPFVLQRLELLGLRDQLARVDALATQELG